MALVQPRLVPTYRKAPFGVGTWTFSFSYAAASVVAIRWLYVEQTPGRQALTWMLLAVLTAGIAVLAGRRALGGASGNDGRYAGRRHRWSAPRVALVGSSRRGTRAGAAARPARRPPR